MPKMKQVPKSTYHFQFQYYFFCFLLVIIAGCGGGNYAEDDLLETGTINATVKWANDIAESIESMAYMNQAQSPSGNVCDDYLISTITCNIHDASDTRIVSETWPCAAREGSIESPVGSGMSLELGGIVGDTVQWRGQANDITVTSGGTTEVTVEMIYVGSNTAAPTITSQTPSFDETDVSLNTVLTATFSERVVEASVNTTTFTLQTSGTNTDGTVTYNPNSQTATFVPSSTLEASTSYTAIITTGVENLAGIQMEADYVWSFTTSAGPDITPPTITYTSPADAETEVPIDKIIDITFSETMDADSITTSSFLLKDSSGGNVSGGISMSGSTSFFFTPDLDLNFKTVYEATITTDVRDSAGNNMPSDYIWSFTTRNLVVWPKLQYTIRDWTNDGAPDGFVGADPFLDIKPGTEDRAVLEYEIYSVSNDLTDANLVFIMGTLDPGGAAGLIYVYWFEANGFSDLDDWYPKTNDPTKGGLLVTFPGVNTTGRQTYSFPVKDAVATVRANRGFIGFLFLATGSDRYYILNASRGGTPEQRAKLVIEQ